MVEGTWLVRYRGGGELRQYEHATETALSAIDWPRVGTLEFDSPWATTVLQIPELPAGQSFELRQRTVGGIGLLECRWFLLCRFDLTVPRDVDRAFDTYQAALRSALYWSPDGQTHACDRFYCPVAAEAQLEQAKGRSVVVASACSSVTLLGPGGLHG